MPPEHPSLEQFARTMWSGGPQAPWKPVAYGERSVHADLDLLYDPDPAQLQRNVDRFVERMVALKPDVVLLQAFYGATGFACAATVVLLALAFLASLASALTARTTQFQVQGGK